MRARVKHSARLQLIIVHYHLRPGGVRRVIEMAAPHLVRALGGKCDSIVLATGEAPDAEWLRDFRASLAPLVVEVRALAGVGYISEQRGNGAALVKKVASAVRALLGKKRGGDAFVWAHNLGLGRNLLLAHELSRASIARDIPLLMHQHDWWFDNRWQRWPELRRCGFRTLRSVAQAALPAGPQIAHATINREDTRLLSKHLPGRVHWLPNLGQRGRAPSSAKLRHARNWLRDQLKSDAPVWLVPCRLLRRKNIAEALLLTRWLRPEATLVTTGGASSADEKAYADRLASAARDHGWRVHFGLLSGELRERPAVSELLAASEAILLTSIQEIGRAHV